MNLRKEIPQRAFINAQIVQLVDKNGDWEGSTSSVANHYGLGQYQFMGPAYVVSLLYCLLVVPKEIWIKKNKDHNIHNEIDINELKKRVSSYTSTNQNFDSDFVFNFIHKLRNSVAHANYEIDENMNFKFWDEYGGNENFRCELDKENLMWLLSVIGEKMANLRRQA